MFGCFRYLESPELVGIKHTDTCSSMQTRVDSLKTKRTAFKGADGGFSGRAAFLSRFNRGGVVHGKLSKNSNTDNRTYSRTLELPLLVRSSVFSFLFVPESRFFGLSLAPFPGEEILDHLAQSPTPLLAHRS